MNGFTPRRREGGEGERPLSHADLICDQTHSALYCFLPYRTPQTGSLSALTQACGMGGGGPVPRGALGRPRPVSHADSTLMKC